MSVIGPVFGYLLGSLCAKIYVDFEYVDMGEWDERDMKRLLRSCPKSMTDLILLHRYPDDHPRRRPLGGGLVAGLPHRRHHHAHICRPVLVPAQIAACPCGQARSQLHAGANQVHHGLPQPGAQVQTGGASKPPADGQGCVFFSGSPLHLYIDSPPWVKNCPAPAVPKAPAGPNEVTFTLHLKCFFPFFRRLCPNSEESLWEPGLHRLLVCDHPSVQLPHRDGHLQTQIHRAALRPVGVDRQLPHG